MRQSLPVLNVCLGAWHLTPWGCWKCGFWPCSDSRIRNLEMGPRHLHHDQFPTWFFFFKDFIYLFLERGEGKKKERRETSVCGCLSSTPYWGPSLQPRHVPWLGIEPTTLWFAGQHSIHWATPARADSYVYANVWGSLTEGKGFQDRHGKVSVLSLLKLALLLWYQLENLEVSH